MSEKRQETAKPEEDHGQNNARAWLDSIREMVAALEALESGETEETTIDGDTYTDSDEVRGRIEESALSVQVRSGWYTPGETPKAEEFEILLTTGGPALRIIGELDDYGQANNARLEYQDWGTPWTRFSAYQEDGVSIQEASAAESDVLTFAQCFYFGE
ncbi:MAG: hypothetical protein WC565_10660 [Parcubacteria group bacterium]